MVANDLLFSQIQDLLISNSIFGGSVLTLSLSGNYYLYKKLKESNDLGEEYSELLRHVKPLLDKIILGEKFSKIDIDDAKEIRKRIKYKYGKKC